MSPEITFESCTTKEQLKRFFRNHAQECLLPHNITPASYARLALRKLRSSNVFISEACVLRPDQDELLERVIEQNSMSWDSYCDALAVEQILCVGW